MDSTTIMISLFPIVFVIHELEEILMLEKWKSGKVEMLSHRYPAIARMLSAMSRRGFALIAAEETPWAWEQAFICWFTSGSASS